MSDNNGANNIFNMALPLIGQLQAAFGSLMSGPQLLCRTINEAEIKILEKSLEDTQKAMEQPNPCGPSPDIQGWERLLKNAGLPILPMEDAAKMQKQVVSTYAELLKGYIALLRLANAASGGETQEPNTPAPEAKKAEKVSIS